MIYPYQEMNELEMLARLHGVQTSYLGMDKVRRRAPVSGVLAVLRALGVPVERMSDVPAARYEARRALTRRVLEPVHVAWAGTPAAISFQLSEALLGERLRCEWRLEEGEVRRSEFLPERLPVQRVRQVDGRRFMTLQLDVPRGLPMGYHHLEIERGNERHGTQIFCAPQSCYQGASRNRTWGVFAPLYALHSANSWGAGNFADLEDFIEWVSGQGGHFVGTLPLLPVFLDRPCEPSPYSPVSRLFWNEFYLDLKRIPELATCPAAQRLMQSSSFQRQCGKLRASSVVDYAAQMSLKRQVLEVLSRSFFAKPSRRRREFEVFLSGQPHLADYARFRAVHEHRGESWRQWPRRLCAGQLCETDCRQSEFRFWLYAQWLAREQMGQLSERARGHGVELYLDLPLGVHRDGYDAWRFQGLFAWEASGGAPPDPVFTQGQDWGFAPVHPQRSREQGHSYIRAYLRHHLKYARMLRLDHVMGLHRLYWVPRGLSASLGAYVKYPDEEFYAMLSIESHRQSAVIIGENLGTVPNAVNRSLKRHGISGMFVVQYEVRPLPARALRPVPADSMASLNTHDMPPFAAFWQGLDIADRLNLGLMRRGEVARENRLRERMRRSLVRLLHRCGLPKREHRDVFAVYLSILRHLGASPAHWLMLNLEDAWMETVPQNTPGTATERVNWRRKARLRLEQLREAEECLRALNAARRTRR